MNIGIISSSNGSTFKAFYNILKKNKRNFNFFIAADRECGIVNYAKQENIPFKIIREKNNILFSEKARESFTNWGGADFVILFFTRLVAKELFNFNIILNLHPSLLPAFRGFHSLKKALDSGAKYFGTTLHIVDELADNGPIVAQAIAPITPKSTEESLEKKSFIQKVYLLLLLVDFYENNAVTKKGKNIFFDYNKFPHNTRFNPALKNKSFLKDIIELDKKNRSHLFSFRAKNAGEETNLEARKREPRPLGRGNL